MSCQCGCGRLIHLGDTLTPPLVLDVPEGQAVGADVVTVGDLNSTKLGTGARKSAGKPDWSQIPWWVVPTLQAAWARFRREDGVLQWETVLSLMADWQRGDDGALELAAAGTLGLIAMELDTEGLTEQVEGGLFPIRALQAVVRVLEFGAKKYAKGNWAKGMPWSVCFTCVMSHLTKVMSGMRLDEESKCLHSAHILCNLIFLLGYRSRYPEGDDRLPEFKPRFDLEAHEDELDF